MACLKEKARLKAQMSSLLAPHDGVGEIVEWTAVVASPRPDPPDWSPSPSEVAAAVSELAPVVAQSNEAVAPLRGKRARKAKESPGPGIRGGPVGGLVRRA